MTENVDVDLVQGNANTLYVVVPVCNHVLLGEKRKELYLYMSFLLKTCSWGKRITFREVVQYIVINFSVF